MTPPDKLMVDITVMLRRISDMINMGEKISWGQETALMDQAADEIERLRDALKKIAPLSNGATTDESPELKAWSYEAIAERALNQSTTSDKS